MSRLAIAVSRGVAAAALCVALVPSPPSVAAGASHVVVSHDTWRSTNGACSADVERLTVTGVPPDVKARVEALLTKTLLALDDDANRPTSELAAGCAKRKADYDGSSMRANGPYREERTDEWTLGLTTGRWISVRLHASLGNDEQAHPSDEYRDVTFDLTHGGYPVPTGGFYTSAQRKALDAAIFKYDVKTIDSYGEENAPLNQADIASLGAVDLTLHLESTSVLVTSRGIEITGINTDGASRNEVIPIPYAALAGVGTPGGPLDATTR